MQAGSGRSPGFALRSAAGPTALVRRARRSLTWRLRLLWRTRAAVELQRGAYRAAGLVRPQSAALLVKLAEAEMALRDPDAFTSWRPALAAAPEQLDLYPRYAEALWSYGRWSESVDLWRRWDEARRAAAREEELDRLPVRVLGHTFAKHIGHLAMLELAVKQHLLDGAPRPLLVTHSGAVANRCYLDLWRRHADVLVLRPASYERARPLLDLIGLSMHVWPRSSGEGGAGFYEHVGYDVQQRWEAAGRLPLLALPPDHLERGWAALRALGMPEGSWFVTLHVRQGTYQPTRNSDPETYRAAVRAITERGGWVVRLGEPSMSPLPAMPNVIDYAHSDARADWLDVFLLAACRFLLGSQSGPFQVPGTFGVPAVQANWHPLSHQYWHGGDLFIPKRYWSRRGRRFLTYAEAAATRVGGATDFETLAAERVALVDNTPEEIEAMTLEMLRRLDGTETYDDGDDRLQRAYDALPFALPRNSPGRPRVGRAFLREHAALVV